MGARRVRLIAAVALLFVASPGRATSPSFSLAPASPSLGAATPATVLSPAVPPAPGPLPAPVVGIPAAVLGLGAGDVVNGFSFGLAAAVGPLTQIFFSVDAAAVGAPGPAVPANVACEAIVGQAEADIFDTAFFPPPPPLPNVQYLDANGIADSACGPPAAPGLGLLEPGPPDNVIGLEMCPVTTVFAAGALTAPVYFTLAPGSPTLGLVGASPADVLMAPPPGGLPPVIAVPAAAMGLIGGPPGCAPPACDAIDALDVGAAGAFDVVSLAPGSPTLGACGYTPATLLMTLPPDPPCGPAGGIVAPAAMGLGVGDNLDALSFAMDPDGDFVAAVCDNCLTVANNDQLDGDADGIGDACDCVGGVDIDGRLQFARLGSPGSEKVKLRGVLTFPGALPSPPLDVNTAGMTIRVLDAGAASAVVLDQFVPGGAPGTQCDPRDGWRANAALTVESYRNVSDALPPACVAASARGIGTIKARDNTATAEGVFTLIKGKNGTYGPLVGPFDVEVWLGGPAEASAGQCGQRSFAAGDCVTSPSGSRIRCTTP